MRVQFITGYQGLKLLEAKLNKLNLCKVIALRPKKETKRAPISQLLRFPKINDLLSLLLPGHALKTCVESKHARGADENEMDDEIIEI